MKDNRRADKISAGPQSQILKECVSCDETNHLKDVTISGPRAELGGTPSKGLIQRRHKNNEELNDYKDTIERERHGDSSGYEANLSDSKFIYLFYTFFLRFSAYYLIWQKQIEQVKVSET